jgi:hypothetical protein
MQGPTGSQDPSITDPRNKNHGDQVKVLGILTIPINPAGK